MPLIGHIFPIISNDTPIICGWFNPIAIILQSKMISNDTAIIVSLSLKASTTAVFVEAAGSLRGPRLGGAAHRRSAGDAPLLGIPTSWVIPPVIYGIYIYYYILFIL